MLKNNWKKWLEKKNITLPNIYPKVIIEGSDGVGKSTIIDILTTIVKHSFIVHTSAPPRGNGKCYYNTLLLQIVDLMKCLKQPIFIDRFHIGELVYGSIFRPETIDKEVEEQLYKMEEMLLKENVKMIYIKADINTVIQRVKERGDWYIKPENIKTIMNKYDEKLRKSKLPIYTLDTSNNITGKDILNVMKFIYDIKK